MCRTYNCQSKRKKKTVFVPDVAKWDTEDAIVKSTHGANFASWIHMPRKLATSMEKFVKDNPIASSRRNTPLQVQGQRAAVNPQERPQQPLFPHPPVQRYSLTVIPQIAMHNLTPQEEERESREHSQKSPQNQMKEVRTPVLKQFPHQKSCQDVCMDPRYQKPPQYAEINYHRPSPQIPVEVNEIGPTICSMAIGGGPFPLISHQN